MIEGHHIEDFIRDGVVVIEGVLTDKEVEEARCGLHDYLRERGIDHESLEETGHKLASLSSTNGKGGVLDIYNAPFKLKVAENSKVVDAICNIWQCTYANKESDNGLWAHPYGEFQCDSPLMAIDRVCYRVPDRLSVMLGSKRKPLQRNLSPHLDLAVDGGIGDLAKFRPVQGFVALTDCLEPNHGGFECCRGFHRYFSKWKHERPKGPKYQGAFTPIRPVEDADVLERLSHVPCKAGSLVLWDYRLPHASTRNMGNIPREVIYISLLPRVQRNVDYVRDQLKRYNEGGVPVDFWGSQEQDQGERQHATGYKFSSQGNLMMGMDGI